MREMGVPEEEIHEVSVSLHLLLNSFLSDTIYYICGVDLEREAWEHVWNNRVALLKLEPLISIS